MNEDLDQEFRMVATEIMLETDVDQGAEHVRQLATRVAQRMNQVAAARGNIAVKFRAFMAEHDEDMLSDPVIMEKVKAREQVLMRAFPGMDDETRWHRAAAEVRKRYGDANQRVIRGMRQQRLGARLSSDTESYNFDTGNSDDDLDDDAVDAAIAADRSNAIMEMRVGRMGREVKVDKARFNEQELRRRQRG
jgi:hypothetical protein